MKKRILAIFAALALLAATAVVASAESGSVTVTGGNLGVTPANVSFTAVNPLTGQDATTTSAASGNAWTAVDPTGTGTGWNLTITSGDFGINEVQTVSISGSPTAGTFTLSFDGQGPTNTIAFNAAASVVETEMELLSNITDVTVTGGPFPGTAVVVTFVNPGRQNIALMTSADSFTGGTSPASSIAETTAGVLGIDISAADQEFKVQLTSGANIQIASTGGNIVPITDVAALTAIPFTGSTLKFLHANANEGMGTFDIKPNFELEIRAETLAGTFTATFTVAVVSGP